MDERVARRAARGRCSRAVDRIRAMDTSIHAWVQVLPQRPTGDGPLDEIPFGAKDIMETRGLSTEYGSPIYKGRIGTADAAIVRDLRRRGAVLLGKTQTTAFAYREPAPTVNPRNLSTRPAAARADRRRPSRPAWCRLRSARRRWDRCCGRRRIAA